MTKEITITKTIVHSNIHNEEISSQGWANLIYNCISHYKIIKIIKVMPISPSPIPFHEVLDVTFTIEVNI